MYWALRSNTIANRAAGDVSDLVSYYKYAMQPRYGQQAYNQFIQVIMGNKNVLDTLLPKHQRTAEYLRNIIPMETLHNAIGSVNAKNLATSNEVYSDLWDNVSQSYPV